MSTAREAETKRQWLAKLDELGPDVVRSKLSHPEAAGPGAGARVIGICALLTDTDGQTRQIEANRKFCEDWLANQDRTARGRATRMFWLTAVGAAAAVIAAIASVATLLAN